MYNLLKEASLTFDLSLFSFIEKESGEDLAPMLDFCEKLILVEKPRYREPRWASLDPPEVCEYRSPAMARAIAQSKPPVLEVEYTQLASYPAEILVEHDLTFDLYRQVYLQKQTFSAWWDWQRWLRFERRALRRVKRVVVMSEKDRQLSGCPHATVIPNGVDLSRYMPTPEPDTRRVLFIGSFRHFPNVLAFKFLIEQVWERIPNAELTVVAGPNPELHYSRMDSLPGNVRMLDFVADVRPLYEESNIAVVPTLVSAGTNIKVMEAMAMQRAVVSTFSGCDGLGLTHGESIWIADGPENFAQGLIELLNDAPRRKAIAAAGRRHAEEHFSWKQLGELQRQLLSEFAEPPLQVRAAVAEDTNGIAGIQSSSLKFLNDKSFVATFNGKIAGFLAMRQTAPGESEILDVIVAPENRRQGVGTRLVAEALKHCDGAMFLEVRRSNEAAKVLYEKLGFREVGIRQEYYTDPPEAALVLRFRL
jgi:ribosomal-protein-alanine acetyltransferase